MRDTDHCTDQSTLFLRFKLNCQIVKTLKGTEYVNRRFYSHSYSEFSIFQMVQIYEFFFYSYQHLISHSGIREINSFLESVSVLLDAVFPTQICKSNQFSLEGFLENFPNFLISISISFLPWESVLLSTRKILTRLLGKSLRLELFCLISRMYLN